jgi:hypothetical protein
MATDHKLVTCHNQLHWSGPTPQNQLNEVQVSGKLTKVILNTQRPYLYECSSTFIWTKMALSYRIPHITRYRNRKLSLIIIAAFWV